MHFACDAVTSPTPPSRVRCSALTVIPPGDWICSFRIRVPTPRMLIFSWIWPPNSDADWASKASLGTFPGWGLGMLS